MKKLTLLILIFIIAIPIFASERQCCTCVGKYGLGSWDIKNIEVQLVDNPNSVELLFKLAVKNHCAQKDVKSLDYLNRLLALDSTYGEAYYLHGNLLVNLYSRSEINKDTLLLAYDFFAQALLYGARKAETYYALGVIKERLKINNDGLGMYKKSMEYEMCCDPSMPYLKSIGVLLNEGEVVSAYGLYLKAKPIEIQFDSYLNFLSQHFWNEEMNSKLMKHIFREDLTMKQKEFLIEFMFVHIRESDLSVQKKIKKEVPSYNLVVNEK